jgi:hypothetical protein
MMEVPKGLVVNISCWAVNEAKVLRIKDNRSKFAKFTALN